MRAIGRRFVRYQRGVMREEYIHTRKVAYSYKEKRRIDTWREKCMRRKSDSVIVHIGRAYPCKETYSYTAL